MASNKKNLRVCEVKATDNKIYNLFIGVDTLDQVNDIIQQWALDEFGETLDLPTALILNQDITDLSKVPATDNYVYLQAPVSAYMEVSRYAGVKLPLPTFPIELNGSDQYVMPEHNAFLFSEIDFGGFFGEYVIPEQAFTLSEGVNYIGVTYNTGSPIWQIYSSFSSFNFSSIIPALIVLNFEDTLYITPIGGSGTGAPEQLLKTRNSREKFNILDFFTLANNTKNIQLGAITVSYGLNEIDCLAVDTGAVGEDMYLYFKDSSQIWQKSKITDYIDTQYQSASGLAALVGGEFVINNIYRVVDETQKLLFVTLSNKFTSQADAEKAELDTDLPDIISASSVLVGRFIVEESNVSLLKQKVQKVNFGVIV
jgi:hypothetical protein